MPATDDAPQTEDAPRRRGLRRKSTNTGGNEPPRFRPVDLALLVLGTLMIVTSICMSVLLPETPRVLALQDQVSVTSVLSAAQDGQIASVRLPPTGTGASAVTANAITAGPLVEELGQAIEPGTQINFYVPTTAQSYLLEQFADSGVTVWMSATAPKASGPRVLAPTTAVPTSHSSGTSGRDVLRILSLLVGILLTAVGGLRMVTYRSQLKAARSAAAAAAPSEVPTTRFDDVAGADEAVEQMRELVDYLADPERFTAVGARIPKGALLVGPPGTGKTLLARAVAGEAGVTFHAVAGSDFVEKFVGVGAQRVRALFAKARKSERAIIFIDEIDAVARRRSSNSDNGGHQESENTLIALLNEMDGFSDSSIIVLAATNRPDILDPALTRPGRLDRRIEVPLPDRRGRQRILGVHARNLPLAADVNLEAVAKRTPGFSGAQLESVLNEAALEAARERGTQVTSAHIDAAIATVAMGRARVSALVTDRDREITAWHEAGHTVAALLLADADAPVAVSIVPRGPAGGVTWMSGSDEQFISRAKAHARLVVALGGRAAEKMLLDGEFTQGASGDLQQATETALLMATRYGMTRLGLASRAEHLGGTTTKEVAEVVEELLAEAHAEAMHLLESHKGLVEAIATALLEHEDLDARDLDLIAMRCGVTPASRPTPVPAAPQPKRRAEVEAPAAAPVAPVLPVAPAMATPRPSSLTTERASGLGYRVRAAWQAARGELRGRRPIG